MRRTLRFFVVLAAVFATCRTEARACGDKFLVVGRGVHYTRRAAVHPASILIYMNPASQVKAADKDVHLEANLKEAGHRVLTVQDAAHLEGALKSAKYDLILADFADGQAIEKRVASDPSKPVVVPVLYNPTAEQLSGATRQYGCALKSPSKDYLATIDEVMLQKLKQTEARPSKVN